jgi:hypothetical protein
MHNTECRNPLSSSYRTDEDATPTLDPIPRRYLDPWLYGPRRSRRLLRAELPERPLYRTDPLLLPACGDDAANQEAFSAPRQIPIALVRERRCSFMAPLI